LVKAATRHYYSLLPTDGALNVAPVILGCFCQFVLRMHTNC